MEINDLILRLYDIDAIKFGTCTLKSGIESPFYIDLRLVPSYPLLLKAVSEEMWKKIAHLDFEVLCGVPYSALPITTTIALLHNRPMIMKRKEIKEYGTKKAIEGAYKSGQRCVIVEDLVTTGMSTIETGEALKYEGLIVKDAVVLVDRQHGAEQNLKDRKMTLHSVMTISDIVSTLTSVGRISTDEAAKITSFVQHNPRPVLL